MSQTPLPKLPMQDQRIIYAGRTWQQFKQIQNGFEGSTGIRLFYHNGTLEILMPGREHELFAHIIGWFVTSFLAQQRIFFQPTGTMTQERESEISVQADQSYWIGSVKPIPDLSIEVVFSSGTVDKLARYRALKVPEVWFWEDGILTLYSLSETGYQSIEQSQLPGLATLDMALLKRCILLAETDAGEAIRVFQQTIISAA